jgi:hypothetical protein
MLGDQRLEDSADPGAFHGHFGRAAGVLAQDWGDSY